MTDTDDELFMPSRKVVVLSEESLSLCLLLLRDELTRFTTGSYPYVFRIEQAIDELKGEA